MKLQNKVRVSLFLILALITMFACTLFQEEYETTTRQGYYAIQPETLLDVLIQGGANAFISVTDKYVDYSVPSTGSSVTWKQSDYFQIVDAFYQVVLNDTLEDWQLNSMSFSLACDELDIGLQDGRFEFFKIVRNENGHEVRIVRFIEVDPRYKVVSLWEREFSPIVINWSSISLKDIKFDSEKVLEIAEDKGGRNQRLHLNNACSVTLSLSPDSAEYLGWNVLYIRDDSNSSGFRINVDPFTGVIQ